MPIRGDDDRATSFETRNAGWISPGESFPIEIRQRERPIHDFEAVEGWEGPARVGLDANRRTGGNVSPEPFARYPLQILKRNQLGLSLSDDCLILYNRCY